MVDEQRNAGAEGDREARATGSPLQAEGDHRGSPLHGEGKGLPFHEHARDQLTQQIRTYGQELIRESVDTARSRKHPLVQQRDVQFAAQRLHTAFRDRTTVLLQIIGAGLIGVFLQGFAIEMLADSPNLWAVVVYVVVGFAGLFGVFWSLIR